MIRLKIKSSRSEATRSHGGEVPSTKGATNRRTSAEAAVAPSSSSASRKRKRPGCEHENVDAQALHGQEETVSSRTFFDTDSESLTSLDELAYNALEQAESESDVEGFESAAIRQEAEDDEMLRYRFHTVDDDQPFTYAFDDFDAPSNARSHQNVAADEALWGNFAVDEDGAFESEDELVEKMFFGISSDDSADDWLDDEQQLSRAGELNDRSRADTSTVAHRSHAAAVQAAEDPSLSESSEDSDDTIDRVGWDCFFSRGGSDDEDGLADQDSNGSGGSSTDDERPSLLPTATLSHGSDPVLRAADLAAPRQPKLEKLAPRPLPKQSLPPLTSGKVQELQNAPTLGVWIKAGSKSSQGGQRSASFVGGPNFPLRKSQLEECPRDTSGEGAFSAAMTSLDEIMYTNDLLLGESEDEDGAATELGDDGDTTVSELDRGTLVGAFRRGQQRAFSSARHSFLKDEWYHLTVKDRLKPRAKRLAPVLGLTTDSRLRKLVKLKKRRASNRPEAKRRRRMSTQAAEKAVSTRVEQGRPWPVVPDSTSSISLQAGDDDPFGGKKLRALPAVDAVPSFESLFEIEEF